MSATQKRVLPRRQLRSLFVSDLHLGARGSRAAAFLNFLHETEAETIYLVGDILDVWHIGTVHWSETHDAILTELKNRARDGVRVIYLPGNHDVEMKRYYGAPCDGFDLRESVVHEAADGQRYLVLHGDQCDARIFRWHVMTRIGSRADAALRAADAWLRRQLHVTTERGIIEALISGVNTLMTIGNGFEGRLIELARSHGADGVICGHFHKAALHETEGLLYANCGDWVDSQTALVENHDGALQVLQWVSVEAPETRGDLRPAAEGTS